MCENLGSQLLESNINADLPIPILYESKVEQIQRKIYFPNETSIISWDVKTNETIVHIGILPISYNSYGRPMTCIISDTQLFIYGGINKKLIGIKEAMIVDLVSIEVRLVKSGRKRGGAGLAQLGCQIYIFGGIKNSKKSYKECDKYDLRTNTWTSIAPLPVFSGSAIAEVFGNDILITGTHLAGLYYYSVGKNSYSKIFDLPLKKKALLFCNDGKVWIYCEDFGVYENKRYDLINWENIGWCTGLNLLLTQHVKMENILYYGSKNMDKWAFNLHTRLLSKY